MNASLSLHEAVLAEDLKAVREQLAAGVPPNDPDPKLPAGHHDRLALDIALRLGNIEMVRVLLEAGAQPELFEKNNDPGFFQAAGDPEIIGLLLEHGLDINFKAPSERTLLQRVLFPDDRLLPAARYLLEQGADPNQLHACMTNRAAPAYFELMLEFGADPARVYRGANLLHYAAPDADWMKRVMEFNLDPNARDDMGDLPMSKAGRDTGRMLLFMGAERRIHAPDPAHGERDPIETAERLLEIDPERMPDEHAKVLRAVTDAIYLADDETIITAYDRWAEQKDYRLENLIMFTSHRLEMRRPVQEHLLRMGIRHPDPTTNKHYLEPACRRLGNIHVLREYIRLFRNGGESTKSGIPGAVYWTGRSRDEYVLPFWGVHRHEPQVHAELLSRLFDLFMLEMLTTESIPVMRACAGLVSLIDEFVDDYDHQKLQACRSRALNFDDEYVRNRGEIIGRDEST